MIDAKVPKHYEYNADLVELHKGQQKIRLINSNIYSIPFEKVYQINSDPSNADKTIILPDLNCYIIYTQFLSGQNRLSFVGPRSKPLEISRSVRSQTIVSQFAPSGISIQNLPAFHELMNTTSLIRSLFGNIVEEQLMKTFLALSNEETSVTSAYSLSTTSPDQKQNLDFHVNQLTSSDSALNVYELAKRLGVSVRHMRNLFHKHYGMPPKTVLKIKRLHRSLSNWVDNKSYAQFATSSGYYDQSHMIAEYQLLTGKTPKQLFG